MRECNLADTLIEKFSSYIEHMDEIASGKEPVAQSGDTKLFLKVFSSTTNENYPIEKISFMTLEEGKIKNKDDKNTLDLGEFTVATFIPKDTVPLPLGAMEASFHFGKYVQCRADLPPLSSDARYRKSFCTPVQELRKTLEQLPGLSPQVSLPGLEDFSSGGLLAGHIELKYKDTVIEWFLKYTDLYLDFIDHREDFPVLKEPSIIEEGKAKKAAFCKMFKKMTPQILTDTPELYSDQLAGKLGEMLF
jgi:hypothetical protein